MREPVILVTGATGLLGPYVLDAASHSGQAYGLARSGTDVSCDLTVMADVGRVMRDIAPDIVVHAAAMTDVDACERDPVAADRMNRHATANLAEALPPHAFLVALSTIAVYPDTPGPHVEGTEAPVNVYGRTKLAGEAVARRHAATLILRTAMFGRSRRAGRMSLSDLIFAKLEHHEPLTLFVDELFSPLHVDTLATLIMTAAAHRLTGTFNAASHDGMSKAAFGFAIAEAHGLATDALAIVKSRNVAGRSRRALDMRLDPTRLERALGTEFPSLRQEIDKL